MWEGVIEHAVAVEINLPAVAGLDESEFAGGIEPHHRGNWQIFMVLHLSLQLANLLLQLPARPFEGVVDGEVQIGMALIGLRGAVDIDFPSVGKGQTDVDLVEPACPVMTAGCLQHHPASRDATKTLLKIIDMLGKRGLDMRPRFHALIFDLDRRLHGLTPMCLPAKCAAHYMAISGSGLRSLLTSGISVIVASVSNRMLATDTAFSSAIRTTLVGSMIPASIRSTYSLRPASKPSLLVPLNMRATTTPPSTAEFSAI